MTNSSVTTGGQPSWLTWDPVNRNLYAPDESNSGGIYSVAAAANGGLKNTGHGSAPASGVANALYGGGNYIAQAC